MKKLNKKFYFLLAIVIVLFLLFEIFVLHSKENTRTIEYENKYYVLSLSDKKMLINRLNGFDFFEKYKIDLNDYVEIQINSDEKDGKAWGNIILFFDKENEASLKELLQYSGMSLNNDSRVYGIVDKYGSIYIESDYTNEENIKLVFSVTLPYRYKKDKSYNEYINFFLKFKENITK